jgi:tRNA pseudouridine55 synthase
MGIRKVFIPDTGPFCHPRVLPVAVNVGTKKSHFLLKGEGYQARMKLGIVTDTLDVTGRIFMQSDSSGISKDAL